MHRRLRLIRQEKGAKCSLLGDLSKFRGYYFISAPSCFNPKQFLNSKKDRRGYGPVSYLGERRGNSLHSFFSPPLQLTPPAWRTAALRPAPRQQQVPQPFHLMAGADQQFDYCHLIIFFICMEIWFRKLININKTQICTHSSHGAYIIHTQYTYCIYIYIHSVATLLQIHLHDPIQPNSFGYTFYLCACSVFVDIAPKRCRFISMVIVVGIVRAAVT